MDIIATGQISIIDYDDAVTLSGFISSNHPKTQQHNPDTDTYIPDWSSTNLILVASLFKMGSPSDIINSSQVHNVEWFDAANPTTKIETGGAYEVNNERLTIRQNILQGKSSVDFICEVTYADAGTGLTLLHKMSISLSKVENGGSVTSAVAWMPNGNIFKNKKVSTLIAEADLWRGGNVDTTNVSYQWYNQDPSIVQDQGGGVGWRKLTSTTNSGETGYTTRRMTVPADAVPNIEVYKIVITNTDSGSVTYNQTFQDTVTFLDQSDPIQVVITSTGGNVFKNGQGSTTLSAELFQGEEEIDHNGSEYIYKWYKYDKDGTLITDFGGSTSYRTGKTITVDDEDVDVKATFIVEVE